MCPICMTTAAVVAASTTSGAGVLGALAIKFHVWRRLRRAAPRISTQSLWSRQ
jgi:hypothetical protein